MKKNRKKRTYELFLNSVASISLTDRVIVVGESFHEGVVGIAAAN